MTTTPASSTSMNGALADYLSQESKAIVQDWIERSRQDPKVPNDQLSQTGLLDHLPFILEDLIQQLRNYGDKPTMKHSADDADAHGVNRWLQGFGVRHVLREIAHIRANLIYHLRVFEEHHPHFGMNERLFVSTTLHRYLDDLGIVSVDALLRSEKQG